jgi:colanic acid/amylovoran biosynthesis glycosyltransferase
MKIAIVVHGRFHAFDLARALIRRGNQVTVFTNYPKWAVRRFGIEPANVKSCWPHGVLVRALSPLYSRFGADLQPWLNPLFERWAVSQLARENWDAIHAWSGVAEPILRAFKSTPTCCLMMRGSAHIRTQNEILLAEEARTGIRMDRPTPWIVAREEREYDLADRIIVLSTFARSSFLAEGVSRDKVRCVPLGANTTAFQPDAETIRARCERIRSGAPLRILFTGLVSLRKGLWDLAEVVRTIGPGRFHFQCVGSMMEEARGLAASLGQLVEFTPKQPQSKLPAIYASADVFLFPTHEDGFAAVLAQANANGLPIVTTTNCCGPDLIEENQTGWVVPIRDPQAIIRRLHWCDTHREELAGMVRYISTEYQPRDWDDVAADFEQACAEAMEEKRGLVTSYGR